MDETRHAPSHLLARRPTIRQVHLATGVVLFAYITTHFLNHALGLISLDALEDGRTVFLWFWRNPVGTILLYGSLSIHFVLAMRALYARRRLKMSATEWTQLLLGLTVPFLLALHAYGTRLAHELFGTDDDYAFVLYVQWVASPQIGIQQIILFLFAWIHGCIGLYYYFRLKRYYTALFPFIYGAAILVPTLGLLGFIEGGRLVADLAENPAWTEHMLTSAHPPDAKGVALIYNMVYLTWGIVVAAIVLTLAFRQVRRWRERRRGLITVTYPGGRRIEVPRGPTILDISRLFDIPHASVCGGRGRCSTCRVRVVDGLADLDPPQPAEVEVLERVGAPPNVRLACQTRPSHDVEVIPLLPPTTSAAAGYRQPAYLQGRERELAILFADLRTFTQFAERKLPYDVVFVLNRYFAAMGKAIEDAGGRVDKFIGDGVMALFGIDSDIRTASRQALAAIRGMSLRLDELNSALAGDLDEPLRIGIGLHAGTVIVGEMGYAHATTLTAIGDAVNTASRLEALSKELRGQAVVSQTVADYAGVDLSAYPVHDIAIRGRQEPLRVRVVPNGATLDLDDLETAAE